MNENKVTPEQALELLNQATQPGVATTLKRGDYVNIQISLEVLSAFVKEHTETPKPTTP